MVLEELEIVARERNFDATPKERFRYRVVDQAVRFWYRFIHPRRSRLETGDVDEVWTHHVEPYLDSYRGATFEMICLQGFARRRHTLGLPAASIWTRWEGHDRNRRDIELDVVARLDDGRMLTGDVKWSSRPVGLGVHHQLVRDLDDLGRSGLGWANDALAPDRSAGYLYCSAAGFTDEFVALAARDARNYLWTLADLYAPEAAMAEHPE